MPIYVFYCQPCHRLYQFFSPRIDTETVPSCPRCGSPRLAKRPAAFSTPRRTGGEAENEEEALLAGLDERRLGDLIESIAAETEARGDEVGEPQRMADLLRRFGEAAGLEPGERMEELLRRMEAGENPDELEAELGSEPSDDEALSDFFRAKRALSGLRSRQPAVDPEIYFM